MSAENTNQHTFSIHVIGEDTGNIYSGDFTMIRFLSSRQHFLQDQLYKRYLGENPQYSSMAAQERATFMSEINAYCVKFPEFWSKDNNGVDIPDNNVIVTVWEEITKIHNQISEARKSKVEAAAKKLKETIEKAESKVAAEAK